MRAPSVTLEGLDAMALVVAEREEVSRVQAHKVISRTRTLSSHDETEHAWWGVAVQSSMHSRNQTLVIFFAKMQDISRIAVQLITGIRPTFV